jgi:D-erythronate 2-dehydrogenase
MQLNDLEWFFPKSRPSIGWPWQYVALGAAHFLKRCAGQNTHEVQALNVLITGGAGFLGMRLARALCELDGLSTSDGEQQSIEKIMLFDHVSADLRGQDKRIQSVVGDVSDQDQIAHAIGDGVHSIFHLAAVVSGQAEQDFDLGMRVNVDASRWLLEAARKTGRKPRVIFTSSVAVYGGPLPAIVTDETALLPQSSYGAQKAIGELLLQDYSRKGYVDGRVARLPTITVRPGKPNQAASSFVSSIIREPLSGEPAICPVKPETPIWISSPETAIQNLIRLHEVPEDLLGHHRVVNLPGLSVTAQQMVDALGASLGADYVKQVEWRFEQRIQNIVGTWPQAWDAARARSLGMVGDESFEQVILSYANQWR